MHSLADGVRATIVGNLVGLRTSTYREKEQKLEFEIHDQTGNISAIVWNDAYPTFSQVLKEGSTYKFVNISVRANPRQNNRLRIQIYPDTRVEAHVPLQVVFNFTTINEMVDGTAHFRAVVAQVSDDVEKLRTGEARRVMFVDRTGDIIGFLENEALGITLTEGDILEVHGKCILAGRNGPTVYVYTLQKIEDDALAAFWNESREIHKAKKLKADTVVLNKLLDLKNVDINTKGSLKGVVRSTCLVPRIDKNRMKYTFNIVDDSMAGVDVTVFDDASMTTSFNIGDVVIVDGTVSSYNTKSINVSGFDKVSKLSEDSLHEWWKGNNGAVFEELSYDSREP